MLKTACILVQNDIQFNTFSCIYNTFNWTYILFESFIKTILEVLLKGLKSFDSFH